MLGERDPQRSFFGAVAQLGIELVETMGFYGKLALNSRSLFKDEEFAAAYTLDNGRPSVPPSILAVARLLQHYAGVSDAEVIERCRFDIRWKAALDIDLFSTEQPFARSTYQAFRYRLTMHKKEGIAFEKSVKEARDKGLLPKELRVALDSSPVRGRGAVKDTFALLSDSIAAVIRAIAGKRKKKTEEVAEEAGLERHVSDVSIKGSEVVDWDDEKDVGRFLDGLLEDCGRAVELAEEAECGTDEVDLLKKIVEQNVDRETEDSPAKIRRGVAKGRTASVSDPEMRHGRKSSGKVFNGHKAHVAVEESSGIITAVEMCSPGEADGAKVGDLIDKTEDVTGQKVEETLGDCAYSSAEAQKQARDRGIELKSKMPSPPKGRFGPGAFEVSDDGGSATCPAGHPSLKQYNGKDGIQHVWSPEHCEECPLRDKCTTAKSRHLLVRADYHDRRRREAYARSEEGRAVLRLRVVVEHAIGRIKNLGAGTARYFGRAKTEEQWSWTAAAANLSLIWSKTAGTAA
jgi:hypothetical protein